MAACFSRRPSIYSSDLPQEVGSFSPSQLSSFEACLLTQRANLRTFVGGLAGLYCSEIKRIDVVTKED